MPEDHSGTAGNDIRLAEHGQQEAGRDGGADNAGHVGTHGVHQQEVGGVVLLADGVGHTGSHGNRRNTGGADQGVDLPAGELAHHVAAQQTAGSGNAEGYDAQNHDLQGAASQEGGADHGGAHGGGQQNGDNVHQSVLRGVAETVGRAGLLEQVAQHQAADQRRGIRQQQRHEDNHHDGEDDLLGLGDGTGLHHLDLAILGGGQQVHDGGLNQRDQRHVGVGGHSDGAQQLGSQTGGQEDGGGAVRAADDADGSGLGAGKAQQHAAQEGNEHAQLCSSAQQQALGVRQQGAKVGHGAHAHEDQAGVQGGLDADIEDIQQTAFPHDGAVAVVQVTCGIHEVVPQLLVVKTAQRQVGQQAAEGNAHQQQRLELLDDAQVQQHTGDDQHHQILPAAIGEAGENGVEAGTLPQI